MTSISEQYAVIDGLFQEVGCANGKYVRHIIGEKDISLEGEFTAEELLYFVEVMQGTHKDKG